MMPRLTGLYAITPEDSLLPRLIAQVGAALAGGVRLVQFRNKNAPPPLKRALAAELLRVCRAHGARLVINDDLDLALELDADGVHLGQDDGDWAAARARLGQGKLLGVSCHADWALAQHAQTLGADYVALGRFFPSRNKPQAPLAPISLLRTARQKLQVPIVAIGGITLAHAPMLLAAGADLLAVIDGLFTARDIQHEAASFTALFSPASQNAPPVPASLGQM